MMSQCIVVYEKHYVDSKFIEFPIRKFYIKAMIKLY